MVFGIGEGSITIDLEQNTFKPGDTITGKVTLNLSKEKKARGVRVKFYGVQKNKSNRGLGSRNAFGSRNAMGFKTHNVHEVEKNLDKDRVYPVGEKTYPFSITIPKDIFPKKQEGLLGNVLGAANALGMFGRTEWFIESNLDILMGIDISKKLRITISEP